jgi:hypothetical protein
MKIIAISAEAPEFKSNAILSKVCASKYPGASWMPLLKDLMEPDVDVVTADVALAMLRNQIWKAKDIYVIQHVHDPEAVELISNGCNPFLLTCLESPIYAGEFYDNYNYWIKDFKFRILPNGFYDGSSFHGNIEFTFPSYFQNQLVKNTIPWLDRRQMVAVIANKYIFNWHGIFKGKYPIGWWLCKRLMLALRGEKVYYSRNLKFFDIELHEFRLKCISFLLEHNSIDLFGYGWGNLNGLPPHWAKKLKKLFIPRSPSICQEKPLLLRNYKYCLCIENARFKGYVTEKIIEAIVAGVVPIYLGAPNIKEIIPPTCYINIADFPNFPSLLSFINSLDDAEANKIIQAGRQFLMTNSAYSYEGFSAQIKYHFDQLQ